MRCPRCGHVQADPTGMMAWCRHCGLQLPPFWANPRWVAHPPAGLAPAPARSAYRLPYTGPPAYPAPPRWGFPLITWRREVGMVPEVEPAERVRRLAASTVPALRIAGVVAPVAAVAEGWRYQLLLASRRDAVAAGPLRTSDALVLTMGVVSVVVAALAGLLLVLWTLRAYQAAALVGGVRAARPQWQVRLAWLLPVANLVLAGAVLAEIEHAATGGLPYRRPAVSRPLRRWWLVWAAGAGLSLVTVVWSLRTGVQAQADGVLLHGCADALAGAVAWLTAAQVRRLTRLLQPIHPGRLHRSQLLAVRDAPTPARLATPPTPATAR
jgi:hypothetical protein